MEKSYFEQLASLRQEIHKHPDLSDHEEATEERVRIFLEKFHPDEIITNVGGSGVIAVFNGKKEGPTVVFRSELDALPIPETVDLPHGSVNKNISHKCGHDGHATMVAGLTGYLQKNPLKKGKVALLFQPSEENGQGAYRVIHDEKFKAIEPDYVFGLHNIPGKELGQVLYKEGPFAMASKGMIMEFEGATAHAAEPEKGKNPAFTISRMIPQIQELNHAEIFQDFTLATIIHVKVGEVAFGTSPGKGSLMLTLRSSLDEDLDKLTNLITEKVEKESKKDGLNLDTSFTEVFPSTSNEKAELSILQNAVSNLGYSMEELKAPFRWSEDFGHYSKLAKSCFFGLGSGLNQPVLHDNRFDFPDDLIPYGVNIYRSIINEINNS